jgi:DNA-binding transcriptional ArsR family regulator
MISQQPLRPAPADGPAACADGACVDEPSADRLELAVVLAALADPGRLAIVQALAQVGEECCSKVGQAAGLTVGKSTLSHHLKVLRESGITHTRAQGTHRFLALRNADLDRAFPNLLGAVLGAAAADRAPLDAAPAV